MPFGPLWHLDRAQRALREILQETRDLPGESVVGHPIHEVREKAYFAINQIKDAQHELRLADERRRERRE